jgi:hypothetical protein
VGETIRVTGTLSGATITATRINAPATHPSQPPTTPTTSPA